MHDPVLSPVQRARGFAELRRPRGAEHSLARLVHQLLRCSLVVFVAVDRDERLGDGGEEPIPLVSGTVRPVRAESQADFDRAFGAQFDSGLGHPFRNRHTGGTRRGGRLLIADTHLRRFRRGILRAADLDRRAPAEQQTQRCRARHQRSGLHSLPSFSSDGPHHGTHTACASQPWRNRGRAHSLVS